ncbi:MAG: DEAD/DEAH box helicase [Bacilli bacterium]
MKFTELKLKNEIISALEGINFYELTEIQEKIIPQALKGVSLIGKSETGSGKTHSFLIPILEKNIDNLEEVQSLIIVPTRELALQIFNEIQKIIRDYKVKPFVKTYIGGGDRSSEIEELNKKVPNIIIGTIGKLKDLVTDNNLINIYTVKTLVIDEADMVFENDNIESLDLILSRMSNDFQILIFSATISKQIIAFTNKYFKKIETVDLVKNKISKSEIKHYFIPVKNSNKYDLLLNVMSTINPYLAIIFANTKEEVNNVYGFLVSKKVSVALLTGDLESRERRKLIKRVQNGEFQYLVASDIASRGIDIEGVSHIINFELPSDIDFYIHRTGRTARYDSSGIAISLYDFSDDVYIKKLNEKKLDCIFKVVKSGVLVDYKNPFATKVRQRKFESEIHSKYPVPKKVKPNYKKKRKEKINREIRKEKRQLIDKKYKSINNKK